MTEFRLRFASAENVASWHSAYQVHLLVLYLCESLQQWKY